jgi:hypothetical protein
MSIFSRRTRAGKPSARVVQEGLRFSERRLMLTAHTGAVQRVTKRKPSIWRRLFG